MVMMIRDRVQELIDKGKTLAQVKTARPTMDFDGRYGSTTGAWTTDMFIEAVTGACRRRSEAHPREGHLRDSIHSPDGSSRGDRKHLGSINGVER